MICVMPTNQRQNGRPAEGALFDDTNRALLGELQTDARLSLAELGRRVGLSSPAVAERLQRLERDGVIRGYRAELDPAALGYGLSAIIRVRPAPRQLHKVADVARAAPEVVECHRITGEDCYLIKAHIRSMTHLEELLDELAPFGQTTTSIIQSSPVPLRGVSLTR
jgi:Lrp/AsnC family transcriptional regulator, leucine-responsive regulatory protein